MNRLNGKTAVITGGATGIGRAAAKRFIEEGAFVFIFGRRQEVLDAAVADLGPNARAVKGSVSDLDDLDRLYAAVKAERGTLDIVFANAGAGSQLALGKITAEHIDETFDTNVKGTIFTVQKALPLMREHAPGSIVNISSIAGLIASDTMPAYNASKASVWMLSKSIALHCAKNNMQIRCNSVHPTFVDTPILDGTAKNHNIDKGVLMDKLARQIPLKFVGEPNDIANAVVYLASDESRFMTGAEIKLDGGISAM